MRIVIEVDTANGRATVTTEPDTQGAAFAPGTAPGSFGVGEATDAGSPADGMPLTGQAPAASGEAVDAGPGPTTGGDGAIGVNEESPGDGQPIDAGSALDLA